MFLIVTAGSVVRVTGSGMGCPDWPKCFGYYIPPTSVETLVWSPDRKFQEGNIIIKDEALYVAQTNFTSGPQFDAGNWALYTKHDYALFNPMHTWTEYINRLVSVVAGIPVLLLFVVSIFFFKRDPLVTLLALVSVFVLGFEAWLGKVVVDGNLIPHQITYHMFGAILLVLIFTYLIVRLQPPSLIFKAIRDRGLVRWGSIAGILLLIQIYLGTSVREEVDIIGKADLISDPNWIDQLSYMFEIHRTFSIAVLIVVSVFAVKVIGTRTISTLPRVLLILIFLETLFGVGLAYLDMPDILQPLHLILAIADIALITAILLIYLKKTKQSLIVT